MTEKRYSVRLSSEGGAAIRAEFDGLAASVEQAMGNAERSAGVFEGGMERLRRKFDPLYAASKEYERELAELNRAQALGTTITGGYDAALERLNTEYARFMAGSQRGAASIGLATDNTAELAQETERLRLKYDPLYAASKRYERELEDLNRAQALGTTIAGGYDAALERVNTEYTRLTSGSQAGAAQLGLMSRGATGLSAVLSRSAPIIQQASFQMQDFAVQVAAGTSASQAFSQQAPQLVSALGPMGSRFAAVAGIIGVAIAIGVPLIAMLSDTGDEAESLEDRLDTLESAVDAYRTSARDAVSPTEDLEERFGSAAGAARDFAAAQREIREIEALDAMRSALRDIATQYGSFEASIGDAEWVQSPVEETFARIRDALGIIAREDVPAVVTAMRNLNEATTPEQAVEASRTLLDLLEQTLGPYEDMNAEARALYRNVKTAGENAADLVGAAENAGGALGGAASQAARIADQLQRAADAAAEMMSAGASDVLRAQIEFDYRDDPVARAGALAGAEFDARTAALRGADRILRVAMAEQRAEVVANAEAVARLNEQTRQWRDLQRDAARSGRAGTRAEEQFGREMAEQLEAAEMQLELIGRTAEEVAELTARQELLNEARRRGLDLDRVSVETGETLLEQIDRQAEAIGRLAEQTAQANERSEFFSGIQQDLKDGLLDALATGEDFADTLDNVAAALRRAAFEALLFGEGPLAGLIGGLFGGGGKGGGLGSIIAGIFHEGGTVGGTTRTRAVSPMAFLGAERMHGGAIAGLGADEVPAILQRGERVFSRAETAQLGAQTSQGGMNINVNVTGANGDQHVIRLVEQGVTAGLQEYDRVLPDRVQFIASNSRVR